MTGYISKPFEPENFLKTVGDTIHLRKNIKGETKIISTSLENNEITLDFATGIKFIGGDESLYNMILLSYYIENKDIDKKLKEQVAVNAYSDAIQIIHKIKSSSGSIGAKSLYNTTIELQKALKNENAELSTQLSNRFESLLEEVHEIIYRRHGNDLT